MNYLFTLTPSKDASVAILLENHSEIYFPGYEGSQEALIVVATQFSAMRTILGIEDNNWAINRQTLC